MSGITVKRMGRIVMQEYDTNGTPGIQRSERVRARIHGTEEVQTNGRRAFKQADTDGKHGVSLLELYTFLSKKRFDRNQDGMIPFKGREVRQVEKAFFRALTVLMPSGSTFALTRVATIQAARDL